MVSVGSSKCRLFNKQSVSAGTNLLHIRVGPIKVEKRLNSSNEQTPIYGRNIGDGTVFTNKYNCLFYINATEFYNIARLLN